jgi:hypothetical protein
VSEKKNKVRAEAVANMSVEERWERAAELLYIAISQMLATETEVPCEEA